MKLYEAIAQKLLAVKNCEEVGRTERKEKHIRWIEETCKNLLPSGSGIDCGTTFDWDRSTPDKLVFTLSFHHMNDVGMYDGWTEHEVWVRPSLSFGITIRVTGRDRNYIKDYLYDVYDSVLRQEVEG